MDVHIRNPQLEDLMMAGTLLEVLKKALETLEESSFQRFIEKLSALKVGKEYTKIPEDELMGKDPEHIAGLISSYYRDDYGAEVTLDILEDINEKEVQEELQQDLMDAGVHFIDRYRKYLIGRIKVIDPVVDDLHRWGLLTAKERDNVRPAWLQNIIRPREPEEKMRRLYEIIGDWGYWDKEEVYRSFHQYNPHIIDDLKMQEEESQLEEECGVTFIDRHRLDLISWITDVDPVLRDLRDQKILTQEEYDDVMGKPTNREKKEELWDVISHREDAGKYEAYITLRKLKEELITDLERKYKIRRAAELSLLMAGGNFIDRHREDLIHRIKLVDPVVNDLYCKDLLTAEDRANIRRRGKPKKMMRRLYEIIRNWDDRRKQEVYNSFYKCNARIIVDLKIKEDRSRLEEGRRVTFIHRNRSDLISWITDVDPVLRDLRDQELLTQEQYDDVMGKPTNWEKMTELWDVISHWENAGKNKAYITLRKHKEAVLSQIWAGGHFIDRHREDLIRGITAIDPVVDDLYRKGLLTAEQSDYVSRRGDSEEKMRRLYEIISNWGYWYKDEVYCFIYKHNPHTIDDLKMQEGGSPLQEAGGHFIDRHRKYLMHGVTAVVPATDDLRREDLLTVKERDNIRKPGEYIPHIIKDLKIQEVVSPLEEDEILDVPSALSRLSFQPGDCRHLPDENGHFLDKHRRVLINMISVIDPVLDELLDLKLLTNEQYDTVLIRKTNAEKMRKLYSYIRAWGNDEKDKVSRALKEHNYPTIQQLEMKSLQNTRPLRYRLKPINIPSTENVTEKNYPIITSIGPTLPDRSLHNN